MIKACAKCGAEKKLSKSHCIPKSFFRKAQKKSGKGQLVGISTGPEKVHYTQDTGEAYLLCPSCECWFNTRHDSFIDRVLNRMPSPQSLSDLKKPLFLREDSDKLSEFILSVFWRSSLSEHEMYDNFNLPAMASRELGDLLFDRPFEIKNKFSFCVHQLYVSIPSLPQSVVGDFVMPPGMISAASGEAGAWMFAGRGYLFTAYQPRLKNSHAQKLQCYKPGKRAFRIPKRDMLSDPVLWPILAAGLGKAYKGHTKIRRS